MLSPAAPALRGPGEGGEHRGCPPAARNARAAPERRSQGGWGHGAGQRGSGLSAAFPFVSFVCSPGFGLSHREDPPPGSSSSAVKSCGPQVLLLTARATPRKHRQGPEVADVRPGFKYAEIRTNIQRKPDQHLSMGPQGLYSKPGLCLHFSSALLHFSP